MDKPHAVIFTRRFVSGTLAGLEHNDSLTFATLGAAQDWADYMKTPGRIHNTMNCSPYVVTRAEVVPAYDALLDAWRA